MKSLRQAIKKSWLPDMLVVPGDLASSLGLSLPLSLTELTRFFDQPEVRSLQGDLDADALHGAVEFIMRSDGTYTFRGPCAPPAFRRLPTRYKHRFVAPQALSSSSKRAGVSSVPTHPGIARGLGTRMAPARRSAVFGRHCASIRSSKLICRRT
jgi:hypothetical protein